MKYMRKIFALVLAVIMVMSLAIGASAATVTKTEGVTGNASITVTLPEGAGDNTYKIYKVFDATTSDAGISYTLVDGKTTAPDVFTVTNGYVTYSGEGENGSLTQADIDAIAGYVTGSDLVATVTTTKDDTSFTVTGLPYGYYYITTTTGTLVTVNSTNPDASVSDKNTAPGLDKKITGANSIDEDGQKAIAQVGSTVEYEVDITIGSGAENYEFHDRMSDGLSYNGDVKVFIGATEVSTENYDKTTAQGDTITIKFNNDYIKTLAASTKLTIKYSATVTSDALHTIPAKNTAWLDYGHEPGSNSTPVDEPEVYNAKLTVTKQDGSGNPLAGAGFVLKNSDGNYYKLTTADDGSKSVSWVANDDKATEYTSDENGAVEPFTGLANGTYTLVEKTVPSGYNKAADIEITVESLDSTTYDLTLESTVINNAGSVLPSTGGMGTTIFYVAGAILMVGAAVLLVTKRRMNMAE